MSTRVECYIWCKKCDVKVGTVTAYNTVDRPTVWSNVSEPNLMPKVCKLCDSVLERVEP